MNGWVGGYYVIGCRSSVLGLKMLKHLDTFDQALLMLLLHLDRTAQKALLSFPLLSQALFGQLR